MDWFQQEWGRDTFISLPGLLLATKRFEEAKSVLRRFASFEKNGLIPNRISDPQNPETIEYNTVDASLWFVQSIKSYLQFTNDWNFVKEMVPKIQKIIHAYKNGTSYIRQNRIHEIKMDGDGLLMSPPQATWMDADPDGAGPITPRHGKAVEINALWYSNLKFLIFIESYLRINPTILPNLVTQIRESFNQKFWNESENALYDVIEGDPHQGAIRPNMIFAVSHGKDLLSEERQRGVFNSVKKDLLTPFGLRSLSPRDSNYRGRYDTEKPPREKDRAYHQGTVWPWLLGPYVDVLVRVGQQEKKEPDVVHKKIEKILTPLCEFLLANPNGSLPEVFDGDAPHRPGGTRSQAWSVAEVLRVLLKYQLNKNN
ncbi:MAG: hypothetical protein HYT97_02435 [Elusimicrobia bacterium]|nr:hypothetical protein [Elusimicrobiota bacterium]